MTWVRLISNYEGGRKLNNQISIANDILFPIELVGDNNYVEVFFNGEELKVGFLFNKEKKGYILGKHSKSSLSISHNKTTSFLIKFKGRYEYSKEDEMYVIKLKETKK
jgi:hypothetical protein